MSNTNENKSYGVRDIASDEGVQRAVAGVAVAVVVAVTKGLIFGRA